LINISPEPNKTNNDSPNKYVDLSFRNGRCSAVNSSFADVTLITELDSEVSDSSVRGSKASVSLGSPSTLFGKCGGITTNPKDPITPTTPNKIAKK
jgi:hypothetical protein